MNRPTEYSSNDIPAWVGLTKC